MKKTLLALGLVVIAAAFAGVAAAAPAAPADAVLVAALGVTAPADCAQAEASDGAAPLAASAPEVVICCTAADRAACNTDCAPLTGHTVCIHGCECFCY